MVTRGRPRSFDRDAALRSAMKLFWKLGYEGASMAALTKAMGINAPSLYAAFGSKEGLFKEAVGSISRPRMPRAGPSSMPSRLRVARSTPC